MDPWIVIIINAKERVSIGGIAAMVWMYVVLAIALSAGIIFGCCVAMDYSTYRDLQRRLQEERMRRLEKTTVASYY
jgi:hypothetical protein